MRLGAIAAWEIQPIFGALFGSSARGTMHSGSNIDLFLVPPEGAPRDACGNQRAGLSSSVTAWTDNYTRIFAMEESIVRQNIATEPVLEAIGQKGLAVAAADAPVSRGM